MLTVESFRLNGMYVVSKSPVVLCEKSPRFLLFEVKSKLPLKMHSYESIMIDISPLHAFIDPVFASDLIYAINEVIMDSKITKESQQNEIEREYHSIGKFSRHSFYSVKKINISPIFIDCLKINSLRTNRLPRPEKFSTFLLFGKYLFLPISLNKCFDEYKCNNIRAQLNNFLKSLAEVYMNQISFSFSDYFKVLKDSSLIKVSSEKFIDIIVNQDENDLKRYKKKALIVSPERIPRAFPMNRISSVLNDENRKITCQYSLSQFYFQIDDDHHREYLLLMIHSNMNQNNEIFFLCIFNHYVVHLAENLRDILAVIKIEDLKKIDVNGKNVSLASKKETILFTCENNEDAKLVISMIESIAGRIHLLGSF